jgi:predicted RNA-binding Zn-ribbon protein involved in translation (DUF1610 family)
MHYAPAKHLCPSCGEPMILARIIPGTDQMAPLNVFECARCAIYLSEASREQPEATENGPYKG